MKAPDLTAIGSGAILVVDERTSVIGFLRMTQQFFSHESRGQCTPAGRATATSPASWTRSPRAPTLKRDIKLMEKYANIMSTRVHVRPGRDGAVRSPLRHEALPEVFAVKKEVAVRMSETKMIHLTINHMPVEVPAGTRIIEAAQSIGIDIPTSAIIPTSPSRPTAVCVYGGGHRSAQAAGRLLHPGGRAWRS